MTGAEHHLMQHRESQSPLLSNPTDTFKCETRQPFVPLDYVPKIIRQLPDQQMNCYNVRKDNVSLQLRPIDRLTFAALWETV